MEEVIICDILHITWETLQRQPASWVDWMLKLHNIKAEEQQINDANAKEEEQYLQ